MYLILCYILFTALLGGKDEYFSSAPPLSDNITFTDMNLSCPLLKVSFTCTCTFACYVVNTFVLCVQVQGTCMYISPTPIQAKTISLALMGKDICDCVATGTGEQGGIVIVLWG